MTPISPVTAALEAALAGIGKQQKPDPAATTDFAQSITGAFDRLDALQKTSDTLAQQAATGDLKSVSEYMVVSTEAQLATEVTVAVRNKAVEAFGEIMRMQI